MSKRSTETTHVYGWQIEKRPNSFAETYVWQADRINPDGYLIARKGFQTKREAIAFCEANPVVGMEIGHGELKAMMGDYDPR